MSETTSKKHDQGKTRLDLIPVESIEALGKVLTMGAAKYGDRNWEGGINYSRVYAATQRHLISFWSGEDIDKESGLSHLSHALCNIAFLVAYEDNKTRYKTFDDRAGSSVEYYNTREAFMDNLMEAVGANEPRLRAAANEDERKEIYAKILLHTRESNAGGVMPSGFPDLTNLTHAEACLFLKPGMIVKVLRKVEEGERGWANTWMDDMDPYIGKIYTVSHTTNIGVSFKKETPSIPAFVLEIISEGE